tara:strand:+ start:334 stop:573 length:240 start_codon:yes stop_codon:yes gene_type:complete
MNNSNRKGFDRSKLLYKIKVTAKDSNRSLIHDNVPLDHVELMKINPNLEVHVLEVKNSRYNKHRGKRDNYTNSKNRYSK